MKYMLWMAMVLIAVNGCSGESPTNPPIPVPATNKPLTFVNFQAASFVIGQLDATSHGGNGSGGSVNQMGITLPTSAMTSGPYYLADRMNARVLGYHTFPASNGQPADFVLGQKDFTSRVHGLSATEMKEPMMAVVSDGKLFVAERANNRILIWNSYPTSNVPADVVVGQVDFTSGDLPATVGRGSFTPVSFAVSHGRLFVSDHKNHRVLIWNSIPRENGVLPDVVLGQPDFTRAIAGLSELNMNKPGAIWASSSKLVVADVDNRRVLIYNSIPTSSGAAADVVVGASHMSLKPNGVPSATTFRSVSGVTSDGTSLFVSDFSAARVLIFDFPVTNGAEAVGLLGQNDFSRSSGNDSDQDGVGGPGPSAFVFSGAGGMSVVGDHLVVSDQNNNRLMVFTSTHAEVPREFGDRIVFTSSRNDNFDIYTMKSDGTRIRRITTNPAVDSSPGFSPDNRKIVFISQRDGNDEVYSMNSDGSGAATRLTNNVSRERSPKFSPDGSRIVFTSERDGNPEIYSMDADGNNVTRLTFVSSDDKDPVYSPDGKQIAFATKRSGNYEIYVMNTNGTASVRLTNNDFADARPAFSPDQRAIVFESERDRHPGIFLMTSDGGVPIRLNNALGSSFYPTFNSDGSRIAFSSYRNGIPEIYTIDANGDNEVQVTRDGLNDIQPGFN